MPGYSSKGSQASEYLKAGSTEANYATPHRLVQMLMEGALDKIATAKGALERGDVQERHNNVTWATSIIDALRSSLDFSKGGEIATNLDALYTYMNRQLLVADVESDASALDEVASLLKEIKQAWDAMPEAIRNASNIEEAVSSSQS
ncbi:MAG: flagellar export chaperone FliS [Sedimenticola sp.]